MIKRLMWRIFINERNGEIVFALYLKFILLHATTKHMTPKQICGNCESTPPCPGPDYGNRAASEKCAIEPA